MITQLTSSDLDGMNPEQIASAQHEGRLARIFGVNEAEIALLERTSNAEPLTEDDITELARLGRHDLITAAKDNGTIPMGPTETNNL